MPSEICYKKCQPNHPQRHKKVSLETVEIALKNARIVIVEAARINNCGTNYYLEGGGILCCYDNGRLLLQGKPSPAETKVFAALVQPNDNRTEAQKNEFEEWEKWRAAQYSGSTQ